jgi:hypothetical protein
VIVADRKDQLARWFEKRSGNTWSQGGKKYPEYNKIKKAKWICYILRGNCLVIEGEMGGMKRGGRRKQLLREREDTG